MMVFIKQVFVLIKKEMLLEWREKQALNSALLYLTTTIFVCYLSFGLNRTILNPLVWNALFWIIMLFASINVMTKSFLQEPEGRQIYYYTLINPLVFISAKIIYNTLLMSGLTAIALGVYTAIMGSPIQDLLLFFGVVMLGAMSFATSLTMISSIVSKANNNSVMVPILGFPVVLPMLLMLIKVSKNAIDGLARSVSQDEVLTLLALNTIVVAVSLLLFPILWRS